MGALLVASALGLAVVLSVLERRTGQRGGGRIVTEGRPVTVAELFRALPLSVAVNADHHVDALASYAYTGRDLREAYELVRSPWE